MTRRTVKTSLSLLAVTLFVLGVGLVAQTPRDFRETPFLRIDPAKVVVADSKGDRPCGECHTSEWGVWKETRHAKGFDDLHKKESAQDILKAMDLRTSKRGEALCMRCHYTVGPELKAITGVSCESCHGAARDWINVHNKKNALDRVAASRAAGMLRPSSDIYGVTANCFECHTVPQEELVNKGGHTTGTADFDLATRVDSIRHNFLTSKTNRADTPERKRMLFVTGRILGYEYSLRGLANASTNGKYSSAMSRRAKQAFEQLEEMNEAVPIAAVTEILKIGGKARLVPNNKTELIAIADRIRALGERFNSTTNPASLAKLDAVIRGEDSGEAAGAETATASGNAPGSGNGNVTGNGPGTGTGTTGSGTGPAAGTGTGNNAASAGGTSSSTPRANLPGSVKARPAWYRSAGKTGVGTSKCGSCHDEAAEWHSNSRHSSTGRRIAGENPKAKQIAEYYGIGAAGIMNAGNICVSCHATLDEGGKRVLDKAVTCESCHGGGKDYEKPHQDGGNPQRGMLALKTANTRAQVCAGCHRISDERLLAAGHPSGANYDAAAASNKIKHWPGTKPDKARKKRGESYPVVADAAVKSAYASATASRPIPKVSVVAPVKGGGGGSSSTAAASTNNTPSSGAAQAAGPSAQGTGSTTAASEDVGSAPVRRARTPGQGSAPIVPTAMPRANANVTLDLEPLPEKLDNITTEDLMLLLKKRIERIYAASRK